MTANLLLPKAGHSLLGIGLYTAAEASWLTGVPLPKLSRWLRWHRVGGKVYEPLWRPQIEFVSRLPAIWWPRGSQTAFRKVA